MLAAPIEPWSTGPVEGHITEPRLGGPATIRCVGECSPPHEAVARAPVIDAIAPHQKRD